MTANATWAERAAELGATPVDAERAISMLTAAWAGGRHPLDADAVRRLAARLHFAAIDAQRRLIVRDEPGEFMAIVLDGTILVEAGAATHPIVAGRGDVVGEVALLDAGPRLFDCTTRTPCVVAVLEAPALQAIVQEDAPLALVLLALLARKLSLRLRQTQGQPSAPGAAA